MAHFNCPTLQGVELENQGGGGTAGSHWELRILRVCTYVIGANWYGRFIIYRTIQSAVDVLFFMVDKFSL